MKTPRSRSVLSLVAAAVATATAAHAQQVVIPDSFPVANSGFGTEALIVSDMNGGGRRDILVSVIDPAGVNSGDVRLHASETGAFVTNFGDGSVRFGRALTTIGDIDGVLGDEIAMTSPDNGLVWIFKGALASGAFDFFAVHTVPTGAGVSIALLPDLDASGTPELALGDPASNSVHVIDSGTGALLYSITDVRGGGFGTTLAVDGNRLAIGAPEWSPVVPAVQRNGYVNVHTLGSASAPFLTTFLAPGPTADDQRFGGSIAAIGDLDGDGNSEFAVLAPADNINGPAVYTFSTAASGAPLATFGYASVNANDRGRVAALGDIDGDSRGDFAFTDDVNLRLITTPTNATLVLENTPPPSGSVFSGAVVSGPDALGQGVLDLVTGRTVTGTPFAEVSIEPIAVLRSLPNPPDITLTVVGGGVGTSMRRPALGSAYQMQVATTQTSSVGAFLLFDLLPPVSLPMGNGIAYMTPGGTSVVVGSTGVIAGAPVTFNPINLPNIPSALYFGYIAQIAGFTSTNALILSNGLVLRLGTY